MSQVQYSHTFSKLKKNKKNGGTNNDPMTTR